MRIKFGRLALASINFRYFLGPNFQRSVCCLGHNAAITPSPIIAIAAISLSLLPTIEPSLSFIETDFLKLMFAGLRMATGMLLSLHRPDQGDADQRAGPDCNGLPQRRTPFFFRAQIIDSG
jgi:hypothetical protein